MGRHESTARARIQPNRADSLTTSKKALAVNFRIQGFTDSRIHGFTQGFRIQGFRIRILGFKDSYSRIRIQDSNWGVNETWFGSNFRNRTGRGHSHLLILKYFWEHGRLLFLIEFLFSLNIHHLNENRNQKSQTNVPNCTTNVTTAIHNRKCMFSVRIRKETAFNLSCVWRR